MVAIIKHNHDREIVELSVRRGLFGRLILQARRATESYAFPGAPPERDIGPWRDVKADQLTLEDLSRIHDMLKGKKS